VKTKPWEVCRLILVEFEQWQRAKLCGVVANIEQSLGIFGGVGSFIACDHVPPVKLV
jgi:hypothetical protein